MGRLGRFLAGREGGHLASKIRSAMAARLRSAGDSEGWGSGGVLRRGHD